VCVECVDGYLRDDGQTGPEGVETEGGDVDAIDLHHAFCGFDQSEQSQHKGTVW
jgi:hypothetical protein